MTTILEMQKKYPWTTAMREMSGMGGNYEEACRKMLYTGLAYLEDKVDCDLKMSTYRNIAGILTADSDDAKELEKAILNEVPDCSGAMHQAAMQHCFFIAKNGWIKYTEEMSR